MKHIFMGEINAVLYLCKYKYKNDNICEFTLRSLDELKKCYKYIDKVYITHDTTCTIDYEIIKETKDIQERVLRGSEVKINNETLFVKRIVQEDNGDVICYTDKIIKVLDANENDKHKKLAEKILKEYNEMKIQEQNHKKWWQFWKN